MKSSNSHNSRRLFFWTLVLSWVIITSFIIFSAFGYRFNFERGIFIYTGSLTIKSNPDRIDVSIDGQDVTQHLNLINNSYNINGIQPGEHIIRISAPGFYSWVKKVLIHSSLSTEFWNVLLTRNSYERTSFKTIPVDRFFIAPQNKLIAYTSHNNSEIFVSILDTTAPEKTQQVFSHLNTISTSTENIEWSPDQQSIIIPVYIRDSANKEKLTYFTVSIKNLSTINLSEKLLEYSFSSVRWNPTKKNSLYFLSKNDLYELDLSVNTEKYTPILISSNVLTYDLSNKSIFTTHDLTGIITQISADDFSNRRQLTLRSLEISSDTLSRLIVYDDMHIALLNGHNLYAFNNTPSNPLFKHLSRTATGMQFSNDGKKLLYWSDFEISVYFMEEWDVQPKRLPGDDYLITRVSSPTTSVHWSLDYEHVIFSHASKIRIAEIDHRDNRNTFDLQSLNQSTTNTVSDFSNNRLFFLDTLTTDSQNQQLNFIAFPEKTGFFGT